MLAVSAFAEEGAMQVFMNALTVCPSDKNPLSVLSAAGGNSFGNIRYEGGGDAIVADLVANPQLANPLILAPIRRVGTVRVEMNYPAPGYGLECVTSRL